MMALLLLTHAAALLAFWWLPAWAARRDATAFAADGAVDSKHFTFHRQRLTERAGLFVGVAVLASLPLFERWIPYAISCAGLLCAGAGLWAYRFNSLLNVARALPYVPKWYVSPDPRAARFPDRWIWDRSTRRANAFLHGFGTARDLLLLTQQYAANTLRTVLRAALVAGLAGEAAGLVVILL